MPSDGTRELCERIAEANGITMEPGRCVDACLDAYAAGRASRGPDWDASAQDAYMAVVAERDAHKKLADELRAMFDGRVLPAERARDAALQDGIVFVRTINDLTADRDALRGQVERLKQEREYCGQFMDRVSLEGIDNPSRAASGEYHEEQRDVETLVTVMNETITAHDDGTYYACQKGSLVWMRAVARRLLKTAALTPPAPATALPDADKGQA